MKKIKRKAIITCSVLCGLFLILDFVVMPWYVDHGTTQEVPDVLSKPFAEARTLLLDHGLEPVEGETKSDPDAPPGTVIDQNPHAGSSVKPGRRIYLVVSGGELRVEVPGLRGLSTRDARFALERAGLHLGNIASSVSDTFFVNTIIGQSPGPGMTLPKGGKVNVTVSLGKDPGQIVVPDLGGKTVAEAEKILSSEGLSIGRITYQSGMDLIPNTIIDQYPRGGDPMNQDMTVDLFVAKGGEQGDEPQPEF